MSMSTITEGRIAEPQLRFTPQQRAVLELRICATCRRKDKTSGEWSDDGEPLWVSATFWDRDADRLADTLHKGDMVTVTGDLVIESYQGQDGVTREKHVIRFPRFKGVILKKGQTGTQAGTGSPNSTQVDPWGTTTTPSPQTPAYDAPGSGGAPF